MCPLLHGYIDIVFSGAVGSPLTLIEINLIEALVDGPGDELVKLDENAGFCHSQGGGSA